MSLAYQISGANRRRKWALFLSEIAPTPETRVLDVGFSENEYSETDNYIEKHYPFRASLTALGIDIPVRFARRYPDVRVVRYEGSRFPFEDKEFDVCWSNAVLEHVGGAERQVAFLREVRRVAKRAYLTTPNRFFPIEVHTRLPLVHYLPRPVFDRIVERLGKGWAARGYMHLLSEKDLRERLELAGIRDYRIVRNRLLGLTLDFVVLADLA